MLRFFVNVPNNDVNGSMVDASTLDAAMEAIAKDATTRQDAGVYAFKSGAYQGQATGHYWIINDIDQPTATTNYSNFLALYSWGTCSPNYEAVSLEASS